MFQLCSFQARIKIDDGAINKVVGNLLYHMATRYKGSKERLTMLLEYVCSERLTSEPQLTGVLLKSTPPPLIHPRCRYAYKHFHSNLSLLLGCSPIP